MVECLPSLGSMSDTANGIKTSFAAGYGGSYLNPSQSNPKIKEHTLLDLKLYCRAIVTQINEIRTQDPAIILWNYNHVIFNKSAKSV